MTERPIILSSIDKNRLYEVADLAAASGNYASSYIRGLNGILKNADFREVEDIPADLVTMNSKVRVKLWNDEEPRIVTIVFPEEADHDEGRISIMTPMAQAILGSRVGEKVTWTAPAGECSAVVEEILYQPETALGQK